MRRLILVFLVLFSFSRVSFAQESEIQQTEPSLDQKINEAVSRVSDPVVGFIFQPIYTIRDQNYELREVGEGSWQMFHKKSGREHDGVFTDKTEAEAALDGANTIPIPFVLIWLLVGAVAFTLYFKFINIRGFMLAINTVRGKYSNPEDAGEVSHFQALATALSGTVGLGNISGVAIAIATGGPGATFWMIMAGLLGMSSKFTECTLGVRYREVDENGRTYGGPMYYLSKGLRERGMKWMGKIFAVIFAVCCIGGSFGGGNMFQINQAYAQLAALPFVEGTWLGANGWFFGLIAAFLVGVVILGGIQSIARVTDKIVPIMCGIYVLTALIIIFANFSQIPAAFNLIIDGAFTGKGITGGMVGVLIIGFRRAAFSNEAGIGSASIAHSAVRTKDPASEGIVALLEPFIDTVVVCTMTALVIVITGLYDNPDNLSGVSLTSAAFESVLPWFRYMLAIAVILFAFSTMISWSYYGMQAWSYLFGKNFAAEISYKIIFLGFIVAGASMTLGSVVDFSDSMIFAMAFPNVIGLYLLAPVVRDELAKYMGKIKQMEA